MDHKDISAKKLLVLFNMLSKVRKVGLKIEELYHEDEMKTPVHLSLGQEASAVGVCANLNKEDYVFSNHRSHAHYLAKGGDLRAMIAELYCKETGCARGRGGSMHLIDTKVGLLGSSAIVGGSIPHAVGAALASVIKKENKVAVSFFGDAASEEGVLQESMNFATLKKLPVIFVCENNYYSVCSPLSVRQADKDLFKRARAFDIPSLQIDGMNVLEVYEKSQKAIEYARSRKGPYFLESRVQRWRAHAGAGDPLKETYRKPEEWDETPRDPVQKSKDYLISNNIVKVAQLDQMEKELDREIDEAFRYAQDAPLPDIKELEKYLFC